MSLGKLLKNIAPVLIGATLDLALDKHLVLVHL